MNFSKSKYTEFWKCPKLSWLQKYKPEERESDESAETRMIRGKEVGEIAKGLFGDYIDATVLKADGTLDISAMIDKTKALMSSGAENICEAAFSYDGLYCAVDILRKEGSGYAIYEVKSTAAVKDYHYADVAYQKYVLEKCGVNVVAAHIVVLNNEYVRHGAIDVVELFSIDGGVDISGVIAEEERCVEENLRLAENILSSDIEPTIELCGKCAECDYGKYCMKDLPKPNVLDLYGFRGKWGCLKNGIVSFDDLEKSDIRLTDMQRRQIDYALHDRGVYVDKKAVTAFLNSLTYPLYFLDFETEQPCIPEYDGVRPYEQIPFQYSLHYVESEGGELKHCEYLAESGIDPRRELAERLCADIPQNVCTLAYHASTEKGIIKKLAEEFPDLSELLLNIHSGINDLLPVFNKGAYYKCEMGGSFSIKSVLPAVFPEEDYHNLDGVQNGTDAMDIFPRIKDMSPDEAKAAREQLLRYCEHDTYAMVMLWRELVRVSK